MNETKYIWQDGKLTPWQDAKIHVLTHSLHYGSAVFEGIRFYDTEKGPAVFRLKEHIERFFFSAKTMHMNLNFSEKEIIDAVLETVSKNEVKSGYIRPIAFYGYGKMGLGVKDAQINVSIAVWPWGAYLGERPVRVKTSSFTRIAQTSSVMAAKISGHYFNSILASEEVKNLGYDEALLLDQKGYIAEGPGENLFIIKKEKLITPKAGAILPGITRDSIIKIAEDLGIKTIEKDLKLKNVYGADEAFFTGTAAEVSAIESIDNMKFKQPFGEITSKIRKTYLEIVQGKEPKYMNWLSFIKK